MSQAKPVECERTAAVDFGNDTNNTRVIETMMSKFSCVNVSSRSEHKAYGAWQRDINYKQRRLQTMQHRSNSFREEQQKFPRSGPGAV